MNTSGHSVLRSAFLGFAITGAFVSYQLLTDSHVPISRSSTLMMTFVVLCPPSVLAVAFPNFEVGMSEFYFLWTFIGLLNAALYAGIRALVARRLQRPE